MEGGDTADRDRGAGLLSTSFGVAVFLVFVLFAVQLLINLYATSVVTSVAYDAAREVAVSGAEREVAVAHARAHLGRYGRDATFEWVLDDPTVIKLHVRVPNPRVLGLAVGFDVIDRTVSVRIERQQ